MTRDRRCFRLADVCVLPGLHRIGMQEPPATSALIGAVAQLVVLVLLCRNETRGPVAGVPARRCVRCPTGATVLISAVILSLGRYLLIAFLDLRMSPSLASR